jgi:hypothetical protein
MPVVSEHEVTASISVLGRREQVWDVLCDFGRAEEWVENTLEVLRYDVPAQLGATYDERARLSGIWTSVIRWTVTGFEPLVWLRMEGDGARAIRHLTLEYRVEQCDDVTEVSSTYSYLPRFGPIGALLKLLVRSNVVADQCRSLRTLAHVVESGSASDDS